MQVFNIRLLIVALGLMAFSSASSHAALVYSIALVGPTTVNVNAPFTLDVVLSETVSAGDSPVLGDSNFGMIQADFKVARTGTGSISITGVNGLPAFDSFVSSSFTATSAQLAQQDLDPTVTPTGTLVTAGPPRVFQLKLGSISLNASAVGTNTFTLSDFASGQDDLVLGDGTVLDASVTYNAITVTGITAVPEPSSLALLSVIGCAVVARSLKRRKQVPDPV